MLNSSKSNFQRAKSYHYVLFMLYNWVISISQQTWNTGSQRDNCYGSDRVFDSADTAKMCSNVPYYGGQHSNEKYGHNECWPTFALVFICPKQHEGIIVFRTVVLNL